MRVLKKRSRLFIAPEKLTAAVAFYEAIQGETCERRVRLDTIGIEIAVIGGIILVAGSDEILAPLREVKVAFIVDSLDEFVPWLRGNGAIILHEPREAPGGRNFTARHPDGLVAEYYQPDALS